MRQVGNSVKTWQSLPTSNPKPDLHNINAYTKLCKNTLTFTQVFIWKQKYVQLDGRTSVVWTDTRMTNMKP